jgi:hypothetical protein
VNSELPPVDVALGEVHGLLRDAGVAFRIVGGVAVVHHGYERTTAAVDVLIPAGAGPRLDAELASHGFERTGAAGLRHVASGVRVDVLVGGEPLPRGDGVYPSPESLGASARDPEVVDLSGLVGLKLLARRHRDLADVVELLKRLDEAQYTVLEGAVEPSVRPELALLRRDALEELDVES